VAILKPKTPTLASPHQKIRKRRKKQSENDYFQKRRVFENKSVFSSKISILCDETFWKELK
jgi:hypothetical protein